MMPGSEAVNASVLADFRGLVATVNDASAPLADRIEALSSLHSEAGWGENTQEALAAGVVDALVHVATAGSALHRPPPAFMALCGAAADVTVHRQSSR